MKRLPKLNQVTITLTRKCNLRCSFCYAQKTNYLKNSDIEYETLKKIIDFTMESNSKYLVLTGGEPLLYPRLLDILDYIQFFNRNMCVAITTNGIPLTDICMCENLIKKGVSYFDISLKGTSVLDSKLTTGIDCYVQQMIAVNNLSKLNVNYTCSMVLTPQNIQSFCSTIECAKSKGAKQFSFTFLIDNEEAKINGIDYLKNNNPIELINRFFDNIDKLNAITDDWWLEYSYPMCFYSSEQLSMLEHRLAAPCFVHYKNSLVFDSEAKLIPCNMYFERTMEQLGRDFLSYQDFCTLYSSSALKKNLISLNKLPSKKCRKCKYLSSCLGGCPVIWKNFSYDDLNNFRDNNFN